MIDLPRYCGREIKATKEASEELWQFKKDMRAVLEILENGYPCPRSKRKENVLEMCIQRGKTIYKAVVADCEDYWLLIHFGKFTYKRR